MLGGGHQDFRMEDRALGASEHALMAIRAILELPLSPQTTATVF
jgi:hypothetical protein